MTLRDRIAPSHAQEAHGTGHFPPLDGLRGVAILLVLLHHLYETSADTASARAIASVVVAGWVGVTLFFVLSGYLISGILLDGAGEPHYFRNFYARRGLRIFPLYFGTLLIYGAVATLARRSGLPGWGQVPWQDWFFLGNAPSLFREGASPRPLTPLWSLAVEEQVYLFWPALIAWMPRKWLGPCLMAMIPAAIAWRCAALLGWMPLEAASRLTPGCLDAFASGAIVALAMRKGDPRTIRTRAGWAAGLSGLILAGIAIRLGHFHMWDGAVPILGVGLTALSALFASIIARSVTSTTSSPLNRVLGSKVLRRFGRYSFALYLFHMMIYQLIRPPLVRALGPVAREGSMKMSATLLIATVALAYLAAKASWRWFESPILRLKARFPSTGQGVPASGERTVPESFARIGGPVLLAHAAMTDPASAL
jgi:peptidoglycan/LPS O-acetylase OafA/YrhL